MEIEIPAKSGGTEFSRTTIVETTLHGKPAESAAQLGSELRANPGPIRALEACLSRFSSESVAETASARPG